MELDDLKNSWQPVTIWPGNEMLLTPKRINIMIEEKYAATINRIKYPEIIGSAVCLLGIAYVATNFYKLNTLLLQCTGVITILLLLLLPVISYLSLSMFSLRGALDKPHVEVVKQFAVQKLRFQKYQKANALLSYLLLVGVVVLLPQLFYKKDISHNNYFWTFAFTIGYLFLLFFSKWVRKYYDRSLQQAEELLKDVSA